MLLLLELTRAISSVGRALRSHRRSRGIELLNRFKCVLRRVFGTFRGFAEIISQGCSRYFLCSVVLSAPLAGWSSGAMAARYTRALSGELSVDEFQRSWR